MRWGLEIADFRDFLPVWVTVKETCQVIIALSIPLTSQYKSKDFVTRPVDTIVTAIIIF